MTDVERIAINFAERARVLRASAEAYLDCESRELIANGEAQNELASDYEIIAAAMREKAEREKGCDGWISVKDGLPEIGQRVLTCVQGQPWDAKQYFVSLHEYGSTKKWANEYEWRYVTHWMPLPDLPQEATDGHVAE